MRSFATQDILRESEESCEAKTRIDVMFDNVKCEVIDPTETPDYETQEQEVFEAEVFGEEQNAGEGADREEERGLEVDCELAL